MTPTYAELFAGAGGMSLGLEMAGWHCVGHAEIEPHARAVLRHHWPDTPLYGDVTTLDGSIFKGITMLTGGSPCQDLSVAGKRAGMKEGTGTRSALFFEQVRIWKESEAPYILWENVYGAFSSNKGHDFAAVLSALVGATVPVPADGWRSAGVASGPAGVAAWRVLDAQYFGVPQRRRRVFVLGARTGADDPAEILSFSEGVLGDSATRGESRKESPLGTGESPAHKGAYPIDVRNATRTTDKDEQNRQGMGVGEDGDPSPTLTGLFTPAVAVYDARGNGDGKVVNTMAGDHGNRVTDYTPIIAPTLSMGAHPAAPGLNGQDAAQFAQAMMSATVPRRLMPIECERLMGWGDQHTACGTDENGDSYELSDTARYKLCGNGIARPVAAWVGFRLRVALDSGNVIR